MHPDSEQNSRVASLADGAGARVLLGCLSGLPICLVLLSLHHPAPPSSKATVMVPAHPGGVGPAGTLSPAGGCTQSSPAETCGLAQVSSPQV